MDRNAFVADYQEQLFISYVWMPIFIRDGFIDDDTLTSFLNKLNEANLEDSSLDKMRWDLYIKGASQLNLFV